MGVGERERESEGRGKERKERREKGRKEGRKGEKEKGRKRKTVWRFLKILKIVLPYDPTILLLYIYPKELKDKI